MNVLYKEKIIKCDMVTVMISNSDNNNINNRNASYHTNKRQMQRVRQEVNKNIKQDVNTVVCKYNWVTLIETAEAATGGFL